MSSIGLLSVEFLFLLKESETVSGRRRYSVDRVELERFAEECRVDQYHSAFPVVQGLLHFRRTLQETPASPLINLALTSKSLQIDDGERRAA